MRKRHQKRRKNRKQHNAFIKNAAKKRVHGMNRLQRAPHCMAGLRGDGEPSMEDGFGAVGMNFSQIIPNRPACYSGGYRINAVCREVYAARHG